MEQQEESAKMVCLDLDHPEIEDFIKWKSVEEDKVRALVKMGYDGTFEGEAYNTVSGQNSNNSVKIKDEFMKKVENLNNDPDSKVILKGRIDSSVDKEINTKYLWIYLMKLLINVQIQLHFLMIHSMPGNNLSCW